MPEGDLDKQLGALLDQATTHRARPEFRSQLKEAFVRGAFDPADASPSPAARPVPAPGARLGAPWVWVATGLAAAVLVLLGLQVLGGVGPTAPEAWSIEEPEGFVLVGDRRVELSEEAGRAELQQLLQNGAPWQNGDQVLRVAFGDLAFVEVEPSTRLSVVQSNGRPRRPASISLQGTQGGVRVATGTGYEQGDFFVRTPHTEVTPVGTVFGVDVYPELTCVCCMRGHLELTEAREQPVESGRTCLVYEDRHEHRDIPEHHAAPLTDFWAHVRSCWDHCKPD